MYGVISGCYSVGPANMNCWSDMSHDASELPQSIDFCKRSSINLAVRCNSFGTLAPHEYGRIVVIQLPCPQGQSTRRDRAPQYWGPSNKHGWPDEPLQDWDTYYHHEFTEIGPQVEFLLVEGSEESRASR